MAKSRVEYWRTNDGLLLLEAWARDGLTNEQISHNIGVTRKTLQEWLVKYSDISDALKKGKEVVDIEVENALYKNAIGYDYIEETVTSKKEVIYNDAGKRVKEIVEPIIIPITKHKPAETTAQIFWLKNRKPKVWRDKQEIEHSGDINNPFDNLTTEELRTIIKNER